MEIYEIRYDPLKQITLYSLRLCNKFYLLSSIGIILLNEIFIFQVFLCFELCFIRYDCLDFLEILYALWGLILSRNFCSYQFQRFGQYKFILKVIVLQNLKLLPALNSGFSCSRKRPAETYPKLGFLRVVADSDTTLLKYSTINRISKTL